MNLRESARDQECLIRIPGACLWLPEYSILSHYPGGAGGKGRSLKSLDICGAIGCTGCDAVIDRHVKPPPGMTYEDCLICWFEGHMRTLVFWKERAMVSYRGKR